MLRYIIFFVFFFGSAFSEKTVFITGAAGFIGSNFLEYMYDKYPDYNYIVLDALTYAGNLDNIPKNIQSAKNFKFIQGNITNYPLVEQIMQEATYVVHFAAETHVTRSISDDYAFFETDVLGTRALMQALVKCQVERFIHISTSEVYGTAVYQPMNEEHPLNTRSPYAAAKAGADRLVFAYGCTFDVPVVIIRPFNNYGPRQHLEKVIPRFIAAAIQGEPITIHGQGTQCRDWVHTHDVCIALDKVLHTPDFSKLKNQAINIGSGKPVSVLEAAKMILKYFHLPETHLKFITDRPGQVELHVSSTEKAQKLLNWQSVIDFEEGLAKTITWYVNNPAFWEGKKENALVKIRINHEQYELQ